MQPKRTMAVRALPLARALAARGNEVLVLLPPWDHPQDAGWEWVEKGLCVYNVPLPARVPLFFHVALTWRLAREALRFRPDVVHCFKPKSYAGLTAWALWQLKRLGWVKARLVVDADDWESTGGWNELEHYSRAQKRFFTWQEHWGLTHCDAVTVASRALQTIAWSLGISPARVHYLPNGRAGDERPPSPPSVAELREKHGLKTAPVVLLYTRFFEFDVERVMAILEGIFSAMPEARCLVVGKGLFGEEERLLALTRERDLSERIVYAGWVDAQLVPAYLALANAAIYPMNDTLINRCKCAVKLIDLLAAGVPVVAERVGQNAEYIQDGSSGLLVESGDHDACVAATLRLLRDGELAGRLGRAAREHIRRSFAWEHLAEAAENAYQRGKP